MSNGERDEIGIDSLIIPFMYQDAQTFARRIAEYIRDLIVADDLKSWKGHEKTEPQPEVAPPSQNDKPRTFPSFVRGGDALFRVDVPSPSVQIKDYLFAIDDISKVVLCLDGLRVYGTHFNDQVVFVPFYSPDAARAEFDRVSKILMGESK